MRAVHVCAVHVCASVCVAGVFNNMHMYSKSKQVTGFGSNKALMGFVLTQPNGNQQDCYSYYLYMHMHTSR